jgi:ABC-type sugar transport system permease subunit
VTERATPVRNLRDWAIATAIAWLVASAAFFVHRNREFRDREEARGHAAAEATARGAGAGVDAAGVVSAAQPSPRYEFLRQRWFTATGETDARALGGPCAPAVDKLLFDAAHRFDQRGAFSTFWPDGSGRVVAAVSAPGGGVAVAVSTPPAGPDPYPWLVVIGVLGLGAVVAAAGGLLGGAARPLGVLAGGAGLAVPTVSWGGPVPAAIIGVVAALIAVASARGATDRLFAGLRAHRFALGFLAPAAVAMLILVATPFVVGLLMGFYDHDAGAWRFVGLDNFAHILSGGGRGFDDPGNFWFVLGVTVLWTAVNVALHVTIGVALAMLLRQRWLAGKGVFRMLLILPWAIPNYITALIWKGMFQSEHGAVNSLLDLAGVGGDVSWFSSWASAFSANVVTNTWLGFPFMMVVALGALESVPRDMYEAAEVDGASVWQRFWHITLPHLRPALGPAVVLGSIWTFNMFNVIFLVSGGEPGGSTEILVTKAYRAAFEKLDYGMAAAYATLIFLILLLWTVFGTRVTRKEAP